MTYKEILLKRRLIADLRKINMPIDEVEIEIRPFSSTYFGRYFPVYDESKCKPRIFLYPYKDKIGNMYSYEEIRATLIHEMVHHIQYINPSFVRLKGVMHDTNFWKLYNRYIEKIGGEVSDNTEKRTFLEESIV